MPLILSRREDPIDKFKRAQKEGAAGKDSRKEALRRKSNNAKLDKYKAFLEKRIFPRRKGFLSCDIFSSLEAGCRTFGCLEQIWAPSL